MRFMMIYPNSTGFAKVPLGIIYILQLLREEGHEVDLFDITFYGVHIQKHDINMRGKYLNFRPIDLKPYGIVYELSTMEDVEAALVRRIQEFSPDLVGISITEDTSLEGLQLARAIKRVNPKLPCIFGGVFCMTMPEFLISRDEVDIVCIGEGEKAMVELLRRLDEGKDPSDIPSLWFKGSNRKVIRNKIGPPINLDTLPFPDLSLIDDRHLFNPMAGHVYKMAFVESQRGCPRRCTYCCNQLFLDAYKEFGRGYIRKKSIPRLIDELIYLKNRFNLNFIQFIDDNFLMRNEKELIEFSALYKEKINLPFWIQAEANTTTENKIRYIKEAGCIVISMGIETGSDFIRQQVYRRSTSKKATIKAFDIMHRYKIRTSGNVILGAPEEGRSEIFETIELVRKCWPKSLNVGIFAPYRGTVLRDYAVEKGYLKEDFLRDGRISWQAVLNMPQISREEIEGLARTFSLYATLPKEYWPEIEKCENFTEESELLFEKLEKIFWEIVGSQGIDVDVPGIDYNGFLRQRQAEIGKLPTPLNSAGKSGVIRPPVPI